MFIDFEHLPINSEFITISGYYKIIKEEKISYHGDDFLYFVGFASVDRSCCASGGCGYAIVPGYIVSFHSGKTSDQKRYISRVRLVEEKNYKKIAELLRVREGINQVQFYTSETETKIVTV